ncbi:MAG: lytic murein transglycosylase B [Proteobacteria bacterium]|nr:lytic murein transglycosylase B [Pseudomonadota bacterium]MDA1063446.1 lytic murein transglycosylase B [Pseudomonadota bacterium]
MIIRFLAGIAIFLVTASTCLAVDIHRSDVAAFIDSMVSEHDYDRTELERILGAAETKQPILDKIANPAEKTLTWAEYRPIFMTRERVQAGATFWRENCAMLDRISAETGVPVEIIVGIIGVETYFGRITGGNRVLDALATLAFDYPPREEFFRGELVAFLLLVREEQMQATDAVGSYAGAMGRPQFMPSSYRAYAVDATGDGKRDIWNDWADVAGSIANYFVAHGWSAGKEVTTQATLSSRFKGPVPDNQLRADVTVRSLSDAGVVFATGLANDSKGQLLTYAGSDGPEYWVGFHNFFVITRYNHSVMYALAVYQLGQEIAGEIARDDS